MFLIITRLSIHHVVISSAYLPSDHIKCILSVLVKWLPTQTQWLLRLLVDLIVCFVYFGASNQMYTIWIFIFALMLIIYIKKNFCFIPLDPFLSWVFVCIACAYIPCRLSIPLFLLIVCRFFTNILCVIMFVCCCRLSISFVSDCYFLCLFMFLNCIFYLSDYIIFCLLIFITTYETGY